MGISWIWPPRRGTSGARRAATLTERLLSFARRKYSRDLKGVEINEESLELAETLIAKKSTKLDLSKFEDGYAVALKELIDAKINNLPVPTDEVEQPRGNVVNLMDALRKSLNGADSGSNKRVPKKPAASVKAEPKKGIGLVKSSSKVQAKRKTA